MTNTTDESQLKDYYRQTASNYDQMQVHQDDEHHNALKILLGYALDQELTSILDVGTGTGRALLYLKEYIPNLDYRGIELIPELRDIALDKGLDPARIDIGDGRKLPYADNSFEIVTAFGVLHHSNCPETVVQEMLRVASRAIYISDHNIYGWGTTFTKTAKQIVRSLFGLKGTRLILTKFKGYHLTDYDGVFYPFSLFDILPQLKKSSQIKMIISTKGLANHLYKEASHIAVLGEIDERSKQL
ncbi:Methyltransferase type 11 [Halothece sp. PCC 7418]|uniref:class I SAM-dependent methyltransferase n=1 Tax=Halothece sp. (strain PCC 7418) TaxID=65093 RepID=UPI0002A08DA9|nr:class I SAM-dependent methyltransferase [Halothece sp. PCC 7418]AFZ44939.1 Methyltransferase type 11 [Halothece sp. PCC 7418]